MTRLLPIFLFVGLLTSCSDKAMKAKIKKALKEDPTIITESIEAHPEAYIEALNKAVKSAQAGMAQKKEEEEKKELEAKYDAPLQPLIRSDESIRGTKGAPLTLVEYSDFECPFCTRGYETVVKLLKKYEGKIQFVYKHLPLSFHPSAMISAQYYEAIRLQDAVKAQKFHDEIFQNQSKLRGGEAYLKTIAKKLSVNMTKLATDLKSEAVKKRIEEDLKEAEKFGFQGTPGFLLNGIPVKGAYPAEHFDTIVEELKKRGKVVL
ncbi:MAG: thioredoxin domain-containing protein [Bacteriovoracaceae bacterium]|nr:thioredoxin domain-containing protein [Bacteriovoracaceae bacterium]